MTENDIEAFIKIRSEGDTMFLEILEDIYDKIRAVENSLEELRNTAYISRIKK